MENYKKILVLENEVEAQLLEVILTEREIPHLTTSYYDSAYDGIYQSQKGWGHVDAPEEYEEEILEIYENLPVNEAEVSEDTEGAT